MDAGHVACAFAEELAVAQLEGYHATVRRRASGAQLRATAANDTAASDTAAISMSAMWTSTVPSGGRDRGGSGTASRRRGAEGSGQHGSPGR